MAISRRRAQLIHEINGYACWATAVALFLRLTFMGEPEGVDLISAAMVVGLLSMVLVYFLLPPIPPVRRRPSRKRKTTSATRRRQAQRRTRSTPRKRKKGWSF